MAKRNLAPLGTGLERPRKQLSARSWSTTASTHKARHELMELRQPGKFGPDALRLVVALAGRDDAASLCYSEHFAQRTPRVADVDQHLMTVGDVECLVGEGKLVDTALLKLDVFDAGHLSDGSSPWQDVGVELDAGNMALGEVLGEAHGDGA